MKEVYTYFATSYVYLYRRILPITNYSTVMIVEGSARKGYLFQVYERVGVSLVEVFEGDLKKG